MLAQSVCTWSIDNLGLSGVQHLTNLPSHQRLASACRDAIKCTRESANPAPLYSTREQRSNIIFSAYSPGV